MEKQWQHSRPLTPEEEQRTLNLLREVVEEFSCELLNETPINGADFLDSMQPVLELLTVELESEADGDTDYSPHDLECCVCGVTLNNQCLDPNCGENEDHPTTEVCSMDCALTLVEKESQ